MKFLMVSLSILLYLVNAEGRPGSYGEFGSTAEPKRCVDDLVTIEVCQRCAKQTKSPIVYPMCCNNEEDVFIWCDKYINYGRKP